MISQNNDEKKEYYILNIYWFTNPIISDLCKHILKKD